MGQTGNGGVGVLVKRIELIFGSLIELCCRGNALTADGIIGIVRVDEREIIRGDSHAQRAEALCYALFLLGSELDVFFEILEGLNAVLDLPFPVVPQLVGNIGEKAVLPAFIHNAVSFR